MMQERGGEKNKFISGEDHSMCLHLEEKVSKILESELCPTTKRDCSKIAVGKNVLVVAHGNSLRSLIKEIDKISDKEIVKLEIPTGAPIIYRYSKDEQAFIKD